MSYSINGVIAHIGAPEKVSEKFTKRLLALSFMDGKFEQFASIEFHQDRCDLLDKHFEGQEVTVHFDVRGRQWNDKYFNNLVGWKIDALSNEMPAELNPRPLPAAPPIDVPDMTDDLPF